MTILHVIRGVMIFTDEYCQCLIAHSVPLCDCSCSGPQQSRVVQRLQNTNMSTPPGYKPQLSHQRTQHILCLIHDRQCTVWSPAFVVVQIVEPTHNTFQHIVLRDFSCPHCKMKPLSVVTCFHHSSCFHAWLCDSLKLLSLCSGRFFVDCCCFLGASQEYLSNQWCGTPTSNLSFL